MATLAYKTKRIKATKQRREDVLKKKVDAQKVIAEAEKLIDHLDEALAWLEAMPVDDEPEKKPKADA